MLQAPRYLNPALVRWLMSCCAAVQMGVSIWGAVRSNSVDRWALSGQVSKLHGTACKRKCNSSIATKLRRLDACENRKVVRCGVGRRHPVTIRNGVVDDRINESQYSSVDYWSTLLCCWMHQGKEGYSPCCCSSSPTGASEPSQECNAWCQLFAKWLEVSGMRERPIQSYPDVSGFGAKAQDFVVVGWHLARVWLPCCSIGRLPTPL